MCEVIQPIEFPAQEFSMPEEIERIYREIAKAYMPPEEFFHENKEQNKRK